MTQRLKNLPPMQETWVLSLEWEDPLDHGVTKSWTRLRDWTTILFMFYFDFLAIRYVGS